MKNKKVKRIISYLLIIMGSCILSFGGYFLYQYFTRESKIPSVDKLVKEKKKKNYSDKDDNKKEVVNYVNELPAYREQYGNPYIMGRLEIPNLNINSLVTRAENNAFYLNNNLYNQHDGLGVPFFDYRHTDLANNQQINIYGHNTRNERFFDQLPFINLEAYVDENIFFKYISALFKLIIEAMVDLHKSEIPSVLIKVV